MSDATQVPQTHARALVEMRLGAPVRDLLVRYYVEQGLSQTEVAGVFGVGRQTVVRWMIEEGIPTRDRRALAPAETAA